MVKLDKHYVDPRLVAIYDIENPRGMDTDFYIQIAEELEAKHIIDLGCGTGLLTRELATAGRHVIGVDPAPAMLAFAKKQSGAERVQWINGDASVVEAKEADLVIMTGNVAQVFLTDGDWLTTIKAIYSVLRSGGYLVFESRNPSARAWEQWNREDSYFQFKSENGSMETWLELVSVDDHFVTFEGHNVFNATGEDVVVRSQLRFRTHDEIHNSLTQVGFTIEYVYGDWHKTPFQDDSRMMIFVARRH